MLKRSGLIINKKKVQRLVQKLKLQVKSYSIKSRKYLSYKGQIGKIADNKIKRNFEVEKPYTKLFTDPIIKLFRVYGFSSIEERTHKLGIT